MHVDRSYLYSVMPAFAALHAPGTGQRVGETKDPLSQQNRQRKRQQYEDGLDADAPSDAQPAKEPARSAASEHTLDITV